MPSFEDTQLDFINEISAKELDLESKEFFRLYHDDDKKLPKENESAWMTVFKRLSLSELQKITPDLYLTEVEIEFQEDSNTSVLRGSFVVKERKIDIELHLVDPRSKIKSFMKYTIQKMKKNERPLDKFYFSPSKKDWAIDVIQEMERARSNLHKRSDS